VLLFLRDAGMCANVEIKPMPGREEETVVRTLEVVRGDDKVLFSSFSIPTLRHLRHHAPDCHMGLLLENWEPNWQAVCDELKCVSVHTDEAIVNAETAITVKNMNRYLLCYTVNKPARAKELFSLGVDAVFSDCPDVIERELTNG
jgi:glycerophosphoryl diester phosphodiesterase